MSNKEIARVVADSSSAGLPTQPPPPLLDTTGVVRLARPDLLGAQHRCCELGVATSEGSLERTAAARNDKFMYPENTEDL